MHTDTRWAVRVLERAANGERVGAYAIASAREALGLRAEKAMTREPGEDEIEPSSELQAGSTP